MDASAGVNWSLLDNEQQMRTWAEFADRDALQAEDRLSRWLEGRSLRVYDEREPFEELFLLAVAQRETERLARVTAQLAQHWAAGNWKSTLKSRFNLLRLAMELQDRRQLAEPIWALYRQRAVEGVYHGFQLTRELLGAMTYNPIPGSKGAVLWNKLLRGRPDDHVAGAPIDGFRGLARSSSSVKLLSQGLVTLCNTTDSSVVCEEALRDLCRVRPGLPTDELLDEVRRHFLELSVCEITNLRNLGAEAAKNHYPNSLKTHSTLVKQWNLTWSNVEADITMALGHATFWPPSLRKQQYRVLLGRLFDPILEAFRAEALALVDADRPSRAMAGPSVARARQRGTPSSRAS